MNLVKTTFLSSISTFLRILAGLISTKVIAIITGPAGVALIGQFQSFQSIILNLADFGTKNGIIKYIAEFKENQEEYPKILSTSFLLSLISTTIISLLLIIFSNSIGQYLFKTNKYAFVFVILAFAIYFYVAKEIFLAALNGFRQIKKLIATSMIAASIGTIITIILVLRFGLTGALIALILTQCIGFVIVFCFLRNVDWFRKENFLKHFDRKSMKRLLAYSFMTLIGILTLELRQIYLRDYLITKLTLESAGYWQAIWRISQAYIMVITTSLSIYYLPRLSEIKIRSELRKEVLYGYKILIPVVLVLSSIVYLFRDLIVKILFSPDFYPVRELFLFQLIGDVFKIASWLLSFIFVAKAMVKEFVITEIIFKITFLALALYFIPSSSVKGLTYAYALNYLMYFITLLFLFRKLMFKS